MGSRAQACPEHGHNPSPLPFEGSSYCLCPLQPIACPLLTAHSPPAQPTPLWRLTTERMEQWEAASSLESRTALGTSRLICINLLPGLERSLMLSDMCGENAAAWRKQSQRPRAPGTCCLRRRCCGAVETLFRGGAVPREIHVDIGKARHGQQINPCCAG